MTVSIQIEPETGIAIATCSGILRLSDAQAGAAALWETPGWLGKSAVWDFREAQFALSSWDTKEIAKFIFRNQPATPPLKMAFVTQRDADFGMSRMFEVFRQDPSTAFRVFRDYEEAICWARSVEPDTA
jgi:hypothetical protein